MRRMCRIAVAIFGLGLMFSLTQPTTGQKSSDAQLEFLVEDGFLESYSVVQSGIRIVPTLKLLGTGGMVRQVAQDIANARRVPVILVGIGGKETVFEPQEGEEHAQE